MDNFASSLDLTRMFFGLHEETRAPGVNPTRMGANPRTERPGSTWEWNLWLTSFTPDTVRSRKLFYFMWEGNVSEIINMQQAGCKYINK